MQKETFTLLTQELVMVGGSGSFSMIVIQIYWTPTKRGIKINFIDITHGLTQLQQFVDVFFYFLYAVYNEV